MTAIVITTRFYPTSKGWSSLSLVGDEMLNYQKADFLDFKFGDSRRQFIQNPSLKWKDLGSFRIYVCPCMAESAEAKSKAAAHLEYVIGNVQNHLGGNCDFDHEFFLVAHDKDFVLPNGETEADGIVAEKHHFTSHLAQCSCLARLVENRHVYMFKHGDEHKLGGWINSEKLNLENENCLTEQDCQEMLSIIVKEIEMLDFFKSLARNSDYVYFKKSEK